MPTIIVVGTVVLLVGIKSALIMSFLARIINKTPLNFFKKAVLSVILMPLIDEAIIRSIISGKNNWL